MDKQELPINNPAERLYVILTRAAESDRNFYIKTVICQAMELEINDENCIRGLGRLLGLLEIIEEQIQYFRPRQQEAMNSLVKDIRSSLCVAIKHHTNDSSFLWRDVQYLNDENWTTLRFLNGCVDDFEESGIFLKKDVLYDLINDVNTWMKQINESQLDEEIKAFFIQKLIEIEILLKNYCYNNSSRIKKEFLATIMEIGLYQENLTEDKKEESKSFFKDSFEKLSKWAGIANAPMNTVVIADKLLPIMSQTAELAVNTIKHLLLPGI